MVGLVEIKRYKDTPNHTHSLLEIDRVKRSQTIRTLVEKGAVKNYTPPEITTAVVKEYATTELRLGVSVSELKRKEVTNIKYKIRGPMEAHLIGDSDLTSDISQSVSYLIKKSTEGIVFAHPEQLKLNAMNG